MGAEPGEDALEELTASILASRKYATLLPEFVRGIGRRELAKGRSLAAAKKATRSKLHQVVGAYRGAASYTKLLQQLRKMDPSSPKDAARYAMQKHASTRERLPILDRIYTEIRAEAERLAPEEDIDPNALVKLAMAIVDLQAGRLRQR